MFAKSVEVWFVSGISLHMAGSNNPAQYNSTWCGNLHQCVHCELNWQGYWPFIFSSR